jgi:hypothetical protein
MGQHGVKPRSAGQQVPVGLEKVLLVASADPGFRDLLLEERDRAAGDRGLPLRDSERRVLRSIPRHQLLAAIERVDASPDNVRRRRFMQAVATSAAAVVAAETFGGCDTEASDGIRPGDYGPAPDLPAPDGGVPDGAAADAPTVDISTMDTGLDAIASNGIRPKG